MPSDERPMTDGFDAAARAELASTLKAMEDVTTQISELEDRRADLDERAAHLKALLNESPSPAAEERPDIAETSASADLVVEILREANRPMHFRDIYKEFKARGGSMGGKDPANNLLTKY